MSHPEPEVRLAGMFLSVYSTSVTRPLSSGVLKALKRNLVHLHTETDADFRREVLGYTQKLFDRLRASTATLAKRKSRPKADTSRMTFPRAFSRQETVLLQQPRDPDTEPLAFVVWFLRFLEWELRSTASYQRRIVALRSLTVVLRSGVDPGVPRYHLSKSAQGDLNWAHGIQIANPTLLRTLLDLILDPFDDVRDAAVAVLQLCLSALPQPELDAFMTTFPQFLSRAEKTMLSTGRADHADGVARAYGMVFSIAGNDAAVTDDTPFTSKLGLFRYLKIQLEDTLSVAHNDLAEAVNGRPVHGIFAALRYVVDRDSFYTTPSSATQADLGDWRQLHSDIVACIESLWVCVYHVLCADAPEGHVPDELEEDASLDTKEILSYSWRALKEARYVFCQALNSLLIFTVCYYAPSFLMHRSVKAKVISSLLRCSGNLDGCASHSSWTFATVVLFLQFLRHSWRSVAVAPHHILKNYVPCLKFGTRYSTLLNRESSI
jgi:hypothetical protein